MSKLSAALPPVIEFNPEFPAHRRWYAEFRVRKSWAGCPVRFSVSRDATTVTSMIEQRIIDYYLNEDFGKIAI